MKVGLDWDGTVSTNIEEFKIIAGLFDQIFIVTLNEGIRACLSFDDEHWND